METWWPLRLPQRILLAAQLALLPLRMVSMVAEILLAGAMITAIGVGWGVYSHAIPDADVERTLSTIGTHVIALLRRQGLY